MDKKAEAKAHIKSALKLVGEEGLVDMLSAVAKGNLADALTTLRSEDWWNETIRAAITDNKNYNTLLLNKLIDKLMPTPKATDSGEDEGFRLIIEHVNRDA